MARIRLDEHARHELRTSAIPVAYEDCGCLPVLIDAYLEGG
ncbi:MAG TPA: hypothetical protein VMV41_07845 [Cellulomonadaceae bacterium]|nr:hypothetical protein [Cellulomonadaceae bacterium]